MEDVKRKRFEVRSARNAEFFRSNCPWAAISISSSNSFVALDAHGRVGLLRLVFEDTTQPGTPGAFKTTQATEILDFVEKVWDNAEVLLIHCDVGLSRSPAVASALSRIYYNDDGQWFDSDFPNPLVYQLLVDEHARRLATRQS
jgi:predicted protein tyrosine phosphatase